MPEVSAIEFKALKAATGNLVMTRAVLLKLEDQLFLKLEPLGIGFVPLNDSYEIAEQLLLNETISLQRASSIQHHRAELTEEEIENFVSFATEQQAHGFTEIWVEELSHQSEKLFIAVSTNYDTTDHLDNFLGVYEELTAINEDIEKLGQLIII